jgi:hypothetical protein
MLLRGTVCRASWSLALALLTKRWWMVGVVLPRLRSATIRMEVRTVVWPTRAATAMELLHRVAFRLDHHELRPPQRS